MKIELDKKDEHIIELRQLDPSITAVAIAMKVGLSQPAIGARLLRLERASYLVPSYEGNILKIGWHIFYVYLKVKPSCQFWDAYKRCPYIQNVLNITGEYNYLLQFTLENIEKLNKIMEYCIGKNPNILNYKIEAVISSIQPYMGQIHFLSHCSLFDPLEDTPICAIWDTKIKD